MVAGGRIGWLSSPTVPTHVTERRNATTDRGQRPRSPVAGLLCTSCEGGDGDRSWCHGRGSTHRLLAASCGPGEMATVAGATDGALLTGCWLPAAAGGDGDRSWCHGRDSLTGCWRQAAAPLLLGSLLQPAGPSRRVLVAIR